MVWYLGGKRLITLYSTHCPQCKTLETKLNKKNLEYTICDNIEIMQAKGFNSVPILDVDGTIYNFANAIKWVNSQ